MRIYLVRHGETVLNQKKCYYGVTDADLSDRGVRQAVSLAPVFNDIKMDQVITSPLLRAVRTADLVMQGKGPVHTRDDRLMEQNFGIFEGYTHDELTRRYPEEYHSWNENFSDYSIPGGESFRDVRVRVDSFIKDLPAEGTLLLVAHKGTLGHLTASLLGMPLEGYWNFVFEQDCYSCIDVEDGFAIVRYLNRRGNIV